VRRSLQSGERCCLSFSAGSFRLHRIGARRQTASAFDHYTFLKQAKAMKTLGELERMGTPG
jgi:hypothetical protein